MGLSRRQIEVLQGLADGQRREVVAQRLGISEETVKTHLSMACLKLGAKTSGHALAIALRRGWIE